MIQSNSIVLIFLALLSFQCFADEKIGLMPYLGISRTGTSVDMLGEKETVTGYEAGVEYEWGLEGAFNTSSRLGLRNINADTGNFLASYEVEMNVLTIGQSVSYDYELGDNILRPFAAVDLGVGLSKAKVDFLGEVAESEEKALPFGGLSAGLRYEVGKYVPYVVGGYQYAVVKDLGLSAFDSTQSSEVDFSGAFITVGLGMIF